MGPSSSDLTNDLLEDGEASFPRDVPIIKNAVMEYMRQSKVDFIFSQSRVVYRSIERATSIVSTGYHSHH